MTIQRSLAFLAFVFCITILEPAWSQPLTITTIAGRYDKSGPYTNGVGTNAAFANLYPGGIAVDSAGFAYVTDDNCIRKIDPEMNVTTLAGVQSFFGYANGNSNHAAFSVPVGIALDTNGNVYVADQGNFVIRKISPAGTVTTFAGNHIQGYVDSDAGVPEFSNPNGIAVDSAGNVYVADVMDYPGGGRLRKITPAGVVSTLAGNGIAGYTDGHGTNAEFNNPYGLAVDAAGNIYVADTSVIRKVSPGGDVTTWAGQPNNFNDADGLGTNASFNGAYYLALGQGGGLYVADYGAYTVRYISSAGTVTTVAGLDGQSPINHYQEGVGSAARFYYPMGIAVDPWGSVYVKDTGEGTILKGAPPALAAIGSFAYSTGGTPVRSSNPWQFTAYDTNIVSDLRLRVQSSLTPSDAGSWADLPGSQYMTGKDGNWTLNTTDLPTGNRYFRVIAAAPGYVDRAGLATGPETVLEGIAPFGDFSVEALSPYQAGLLWVITIAEPSVISGLNLRVQSSTTPGDTSSWSDLPGGQMGLTNSIWTLYTTNVPVGTISLRVVASASGYVDRISSVQGPFSVEGALPHKTYAVLDVDASLETFPATVGPTPQMVYFEAVSNAVAQFGCSDTIQYNSAVNLAGEQYAQAILTIQKDQTVQILAVNVGPNASMVLKGTIKGTLTLISQDGSGVISNDGGSVVSNDGGSLTADLATAAIVAQGAGNIVSQGAGNIVSQGAGNLLSQGPVNLGPQAVLKNGTAPSPVPGQGPPGAPGIQPTFTGLMTVDGDFSQFTGSSLIIGIAGTNTLSQGAQQYDQLVVNGQANLVGGSIAFGLFDPDDQTNQSNVFQPPVGSTFDVVVASNIVLHAISLRGPIWGDGLFFTGSVVTRDDGLQAVRLVATPVPPRVFIQKAGAMLQVTYATNYTGYAVQSSPTLSPANWTTTSTGTNVVMVSPTLNSRFFRLSKP